MRPVPDCRTGNSRWRCTSSPALFVCDFVLCGYLPSHQRLLSLQRVRAQQKQTIQMAAAQSTELPGLERRLRDMEKAVEGFDRRVPAERALGSFLQQIAGIMTDCHLVDQAIVPGNEWQTDALKCIPIHVACRGTLTDIFGFFQKLQRLDRLVRVEKVTLENDSDLTGQVGVQVEAVIFEQLGEASPYPAGRPRRNRQGV